MGGACVAVWRLIGRRRGRREAGNLRVDDDVIDDVTVVTGSSSGVGRVTGIRIVERHVVECLEQIFHRRLCTQSRPRQRCHCNSILNAVSISAAVANGKVK